MTWLARILRRTEVAAVQDEAVPVVGREARRELGPAQARDFPDERFWFKVRLASGGQGRRNQRRATSETPI